MRKGDRYEKKELGASLIYVLIALSMITVFSVNFIFFVKQKSDIVFLKNGEKNFEKKIFVEKEKENVKRFLEKGISVQGNQVEMENEEFYFDTNIKKINAHIETEKLIFMPKDSESIGGFVIKSIQDSTGNSYSLPLDKNSVYRDLEVVFMRKVLGEEILYKEKISFKRKNATEVENNILDKNFI